MRPRFTGLWRHPDFVRLWAGQTVSVFGSLVSRTALPFTAIIYLHASAFQVALVTSSDLVAGIVVGLIAGVWADRIRRRPLMIAADLGRALALGSIPAVALAGELRVEQLYVVAFTAGGARRIRAQRPPPAVQVAEVEGAERVSARDILNAVQRAIRADVILVEGGPQVMGDFFAERSLDELFLTLAPQVAGRDASIERPGLVAGRLLAPDNPRWGTLIGAKQAGSHLFLRYAWPEE